MPFLDAHAHLWHPRETPRLVSPLVRWLGFSPALVDWVARRVFPRDAREFFATPEHITRPYLPADYDADRGQREVRGLVHVEAGWQGKGPLGPVGETRWLADLEAAGAGRVEAIVAYADLATEDVGAVLRAHLDASERVRGVRDVLSWHPSPRVMNGAPGPQRSRDPRWRAGFEQLAPLGLAFDATCYADQLDELAELARAYPQQSIVLCHLGTPIGVAGPFGGFGETAAEREAIGARWREGMAALAGCPNVSVKLSGLAMPICGFGYERRDTPPGAAEVSDAFGPFVDFAIDAFGAERCLFASNVPVDKVSMPYTVLLDAFDQITASRTPAEREQLFGGTAARLYRLPPATASG